VLDYEQSSTAAAQSRHVQAKIPGAQLAPISGEPYGLPFGDRAQIVEAVKAFIGGESGVAGPRDVLVSRTVKDLTAGSGFSFADRGEHELKGVPERWQIYGVSA
jgi:hypothetical protein